MKSVLAMIALLQCTNAVQVIPQDNQNIMLTTGIKSFATEIAQVNDNVDKLQKLIGEGQDADPEW